MGTVRKQADVSARRNAGPAFWKSIWVKNTVLWEEGLSGRTTVFEDPLFEGLSGLSYIFPCLMTHEPVDLPDHHAGDE